MNRGSKNLVPIAPRPSQNVSLDPRDYTYPDQQNFVWGVPQQPDVMQQPQQLGMMGQQMGAYMMPHQGAYGGCQVAPQWGQPGMACYQPHMLPGPGHIPASLPAAPPPVTQGNLQSKPDKSSGKALPSSVLPSDGDGGQVVPKLEGVDELLQLPLDEECLQKLLSGDDLEEDPNTASRPMELGPSESCRERGDASGDSTCTAEATAAAPKPAAGGAGAVEEGDSVSGAELLTTTDLKLGMSDTSVLKTMGSFGDVDLDYVTSLQELETGSSQDLFGPLKGLLAADRKRADMLTRTKSEAALPVNARNPLAALSREAALQAIADYLGSQGLRAAVGECCSAAVEAVRALQKAAAAAGSRPSDGAAAEMCRSNSVPKRKRSQPARSNSQKALKTEAAGPAA